MLKASTRAQKKRGFFSLDWKDNIRITEENKLFFFGKQRNFFGRESKTFGTMP
jgi:cation transport regulator ChaC